MILVDTREQANQFVLKYFQENLIPYREQKLDEGDYALEGQDDIVIERKQDLLELAGNICSKDHQRFKRELLRAKEKGKKIWIVIGSKTFRKVEDVKRWKSKYSQVKGETLMKAMKTMEERYGVSYILDKEENIGFHIYNLLTYKKEGKMRVEGSYLYLDGELKCKKITGTKFPVLLGKNRYKKKGEQALELLGVIPGEDADDFFQKRGDEAEKITKMVLESKGWECITWDKEAIDYDNFPFWKRFGGMIDIAVTKPYRLVVEVKGKNIKKYHQIRQYGNIAEEKQGELYAYMSECDLLMVWVFFNDETEQCIREGKPYDINGFNAKGERNVSIYTKYNTINRDLLKREMQEAEEYMETIMRDRRIWLYDLNEEILNKIGLTIGEHKPLPF